MSDRVSAGQGEGFTAENTDTELHITVYFDGEDDQAKPEFAISVQAWLERQRINGRIESYEL